MKGKTVFHSLLFMVSTLVLYSCILFMLIFQSCKVIGLRDGYNSLSDSNKNRVVRYGHPTSTGTYNVLLINDQDIREILMKSDFEYQLIYDFIPHCPSNRCVSLDFFFRLSKNYDLDAIVISRYLDDSLFNIDLPKNRVYGIDAKYYGSPYVFKYTKSFYNKLTNGINDGVNGSNMLLFKNGEFLRCIDISEYEKELSPENINTKRLMPYTEKNNPFWN